MGSRSRFAGIVGLSVVLGGSILAPSAATAAVGGATVAATRSALAPIAGSVGSSAPSSYLQGFRELEAGTLPEHSLLLATSTPATLATGVSVTLFTADVDGDGIQELVQIRGTATAPKLAVTDGSTGVPRWTYATGTTFFFAVPVPDGPSATDLLEFDAAAWQWRILDGATGTVRWTRSLPSADLVTYFGFSPSPDGGDVVIGGYHTDAPLVNRLDVEFHALATGAPRGTVEVQGEGDYPSAALAGDLDDDGVGDLFTYVPLDTYSAGAAGVVSAVTGRGTTTRWRSAFAIPMTDFVWLLDGSDITGDGTGDAVLMSDWYDPVAGVPTQETVTIVDGNGGPTAALDPAVQVDLHQIAQTVVRLSAAGPAGGSQLVFSGGMYNLTNGYGFVDFEAIGSNGRAWEATPSYPGAFGSVGETWWPDAGDLNGDGTPDALVDLGSADVGWDRVVALDQRTGATLWSEDGTAGKFAFPANGDISGDGGADVVTDVAVTHPIPTQTEFTFRTVNGRDGSALWPYERLLAAGGQAWSIYAAGGHLEAAGVPSVVIEYDLGGSGRHFAERIRGVDASVMWSDPQV